MRLKAHERKSHYENVLNVRLAFIVRPVVVFIAIIFIGSPLIYYFALCCIGLVFYKDSLD